MNDTAIITMANRNKLLRYKPQGTSDDVAVYPAAELYIGIQIQYGN